MKKNTGIISLILTVAVTAGLLALAAVGVGENKTGAAKNIPLGLDLAGGVSITYQAKGETPSAEEMNDTIYKLQKRVEGYSTEAQVYPQGDNRINIEIPGVTDANAILEELGKPGSLSFQDMSGNELLSGTDIKTAEAKTYKDNLNNVDYEVALTLTDEGAEKFAEATAANIGSRIAIVYDGETISAPTVQNAITNGNAAITNMESYEAAEQLASTIRIGSLKVELEEIQSKVVGAQLGADAIRTSLLAGIIGFALVVIFMIVMYRLPGVAAGIALTSYVGLTLGLLNAFEITLTLPGIAGIILGIGMAVDANVIIFARIREEIGAGKSVKGSIKTGFQKALSAILDGNITTLIAAIILSLKGSGSVKGFAHTLALSIVVSMFTALVITRLVMNAFYALGLQDAKLYGIQKERKTINFLSKKNICFVISAVLILGGLAVMGVNGSKGKGALNYSLEFQGGTSITIPMNEALSIQEIDETVKPVVSEVIGSNEIQAQKVDGSNDVIVKTRALDLETREALCQALVEKFDVDENQIAIENIGAAISSEMRSDAITAVLLAALFMLLYIWFRFKDIRFATSAVAALLHDVLVVLAFYAVARLSVGSNFIACMLTIVGYSINATIVIFDRIRENLAVAGRKADLQELVNRSITQTLSRSVNTSVTTFITVAVLYVLGVASIREFALPLMVGIVCGAYSSVCITGALWYVMKTKLGKKN
ncbi:protein translocase subunit SecD [Laedolimicola ammoniilytica]|uniref:Multifunctional fusion protein n=1 Tax=Laedolimicola ammoniilytica TaxID=2981771 RepID=A0ABT2RVP7_9FIRM|nr:protein translocase subunit SecD [Laedolimicola ammoniilytica]MCU6696394.1 protein translocase subunit SecD [Laedolimicola ammoniilytica]SCH65571.1 bifunctional preprotein translocase subunit SecD/SecF [uncultured Clostridium sp.]